jgi:predicted nuclease of restriction endonuclease-like (RecB) superfamily
MSEIIRKDFYNSIRKTLNDAKSNAFKAVNFTMVESYWNIGRLIVEAEQNGKRRAEYGSQLIEELSARLTKEFGRGFSSQNLWNMRQFHLSFPILSTPCRELESAKSGIAKNRKQEQVIPLKRELTWSHYRLLMRVENQDARNWYMNEAVDENWSVRALERQINSLYYERLLSSRNKKPVKTEAMEKTSQFPAQVNDFIRDPYVLEFLNIPDKNSYRESELEQALIDKLQDFLLELGKGFAFVARQKRISTETKEFYIDLVFYNYILKCFILIDLKSGELTHQDVGQMDMYVRLFDDKERKESDNPSVGIILCTEKDETIVKYSILKENKRMFASKYKLYLPSEKELKTELEREKYALLQNIKKN